MTNKITLYAGDNRASLAAMPANSIDSVATDPPYAYDTIVKRTGKLGSAEVKFGTDGAFKRLSTPFMGRTWDATGIERDPEFWKLILRVLKPGGFVFAFSSPRTGHRQATAMEDAGFVIHPFHVWANAQGMPKAHDAAKMIDKMLGVIGETADGQYYPASDEAKQWLGYKYGLQTQKPVLEPIYLGQKPFSEKSGPANFLRWGVGAFNIDDCRVPGAKPHTVRGASIKATSTVTPIGEMGLIEDDGKGRFPSNLILDGSPEVVAMFPRTASGKPGVMRKGTNDGACYGAESRAPGTQMTGYGDEGSAARFFHHFPLTHDDYAIAMAAGLVSETDADPLIYCSKAAKADRAGSKHPTVKPIALMQYLVRHITPPGGIVLDPFAGSGTTAEAARREGFDCVLMEAEDEYIDFLRQRFNLPGEEITSSDEQVNKSLFPVCSNPHKIGIRSYKVDLSDLVGSTVDLSDLM